MSYQSGQEWGWQSWSGDPFPTSSPTVTGYGAQTEDWTWDPRDVPEGDGWGAWLEDQVKKAGEVLVAWGASELLGGDERQNQYGDPASPTYYQAGGGNTLIFLVLGALVLAVLVYLVARG